MWTEIRGTDQDLAGNYFVAYDPAYAAYSTDGWRGHELTLTSEEMQPMPRHRLVYKIDGRYQCSVTFAAWESATWVTASSQNGAR